MVTLKGEHCFGEVIDLMKVKTTSNRSYIFGGGAGAGVCFTIVCMIGFDYALNSETVFKKEL